MDHRWRMPPLPPVQAMTRDPFYWVLMAEALAKHAEAHGILAMVQAHAARTRGAS